MTASIPWGFGIAEFGFYDPVRTLDKSLTNIGDWFTLEGGPLATNRAKINERALQQC